MIDNNDDPLMSVVDDDAEARVAIVDLPSPVVWLRALRSRCGAKGLPTWARALCLALIAALCTRLWPEAVPGVVSLWQNASMHRAHVILGGSISVITPLLLLYASQPALILGPQPASPRSAAG